MQARRKVVLYGDSVVLAGVGRSLARYPGLEVVSLDASSADAPRRLGALCPAAVILDLSIATTDLAFSLLGDHPDLLLIGLGPGGDGLLVLSGPQARQLMAADLAHLIDRSLPLGPDEESSGPEDRASGPPQGAQPEDGQTPGVAPG